MSGSKADITLVADLAEFVGADDPELLWHGLLTIRNFMKKQSDG
jgi:hypothetical protein